MALNNSLSTRGFSLIEMLMVTGMLGGVALFVMQLERGTRKFTGDAIANSDYIQLQKEVTFLLAESNSCKASLAGVTFNGLTIKNTSVSGLELWSADQSGNRSRKKIYGGQIFGKTEVGAIAFSMPDYTLGVNFPTGTNQSFKGELVVSGVKKNMGTSRNFNTITESINIQFDTNSSGLSTIKSCNASSTAGESAEYIDWY